MSCLIIYEPPRDKTSNVVVRPAKTQNSLGIRPVWSESLLSAWRKLGSLATHWVHSEDWSDWADAQADQTLRWAHTHFVGFVTRRLLFSYKQKSLQCYRSVFRLSEVCELSKFCHQDSKYEPAHEIMALFRPP